MAVVYSQNILEIAVVGTYASRPHVNVWHLYSEETADHNDELAVRDFANNWQDHMMDRVSNQLKLERFEWRSLDPQDTNVGTLTPDPLKPVAGASAAVPTTPNVALLIRKRTTNRPRGARDGRMFLAGCLEDQVDARGTLLQTFVDGFNADLQLFLDGISNENATAGQVMWPAVLETTVQSRAKGTHEVTLASRRVTSITVDPLVSTQRDRLR